MKYSNKIITIGVSIATFVFLIALLYMDFQTAVELNMQRQIISTLQRDIKEIQSSHVKLITSISNRTEEDKQFTDAILLKVKVADDYLDKKINKLSEFDAVVVERLKAVSDSQIGLINAIIGLSATNDVDNYR